MRDNQERHFADQGSEFQTLWGRPLQLIDCQNVFCEISKYARVAFPEYGGLAGRKRIKAHAAPLSSAVRGPLSKKSPRNKTDFGRLRYMQKSSVIND
jgi:alpha-glutamyl/putrescinyl thymine pyrophosphorylase clade 1